MFHAPSIERILYDEDKLKKEISADANEVLSLFSSKKLYPEIDQMLKVRQNIQMILGDEFNRHHGWLIFNQLGDIEQADELANLSSFYGTADLDWIKTSDDLKRVIKFTEWLGKQYDSLLKVGGPLATDIVKDITLKFGGPSINPFHGILVLKYRDEYSYAQTQLYRYHHYFYQKDDGTFVHKIDLDSDVTISPAQHQYARGYRPPCRNGLNSLICMSTSVPAALKETTIIIARHLLTRKFMRLTGHKPKVSK